MSAADITFRNFLIEAWTEYALGTLMIWFRIFARLKTYGFTAMKPDDYVMVFAWGLYTFETVIINVVGQVPGTNTYMTDATRAAMTPEEETARILGSKGFLAGWFVYPGLVWSMKFCMLFVFHRLTVGLPENKLIKPLIALNITTWLTIVFTVCLRCRPFHKYWQIEPYPGAACEAENQLLYFLVLALNIMMDALIVAVPMPLLYRAKLNPGKKIGLIVMFGAGIFVMLAAILRVVYRYPNPNTPSPAIWACRESLVSIFVANAPMIRPFLQKATWQKKSLHGSSGNMESGSRNLELSSRQRKKKSLHGTDTLMGSESQEHIVGTEDQQTPFKKPNLIIQTERTVEVISADLDLEAEGSDGKLSTSPYSGAHKRIYGEYSAEVNH